MGLKKDVAGRFEKLPMPSKAELQELYLAQNKTPFELSKKFRVGSTTVYRWLDNNGIAIKRPFLSKVKSNLTTLEGAYLAGYLDGDGTITIGLAKNKKSKRGLNPHYDVALITCNKIFAKDLKNLVGGDLQVFIYHDSRQKKEGYKIAFCNQRSALAFLEIIYPFLILKKQQAKLMMEYLNQRLSDRRRGNCVQISDRCWEIIREIRRLNSGIKGEQQKHKI